MMGELGLEVSTRSIAAHYRGLVQGLVMDTADAALAPAIEALGLAVKIVPTLMRSAVDRRALAQTCLDFAAALGRR
jgi:LPPG:FO 2-phospho-L-lactate transferase